MPNLGSNTQFWDSRVIGEELCVGVMRKSVFFRALRSLDYQQEMKARIAPLGKFNCSYWNKPCFQPKNGRVQTGFRGGLDLSFPSCYSRSPRSEAFSLFLGGSSGNVNSSSAAAGVAASSSSASVAPVEASSATNTGSSTPSESGNIENGNSEASSEAGGGSQPWNRSFVWVPFSGSDFWLFRWKYKRTKKYLKRRKNCSWRFFIEEI